MKEENQREPKRMWKYAFQEEIGKLKSDTRLYASLNKDSIRDYHEMVLGDLE